MKPIWVVLITVLVTGGLVGGGTYYYLDQKLGKDKAALQKQIDDLEKDSKAADSAAASTVASSAEVTAPVVDLTADWKNFTDNTQSLSFKYPATWKIKSSEDAKKNEDEMVYVNQSVTVLDSGKVEANSNIGLVYTYITNIVDYDKNAQAFSKDINELLSVYNNKKIGTNTGAEKIWLPSSNAAIVATSEPEYIETKDSTFRGIVYFANIGQGFSTGLDCMIVMTNGKKIFQLHAMGGSIKSDFYNSKVNTLGQDEVSKQFQSYVKTLTSKNVEETTIKDYNDIYKNIALSLK